MTRINIDQLTEAELVDLNHRIVERLRFLQHMRAHGAMMKFSIGQRVVFDAPGQPQVTGVLVKYNKKTVTVVTDEGVRWNVSPVCSAVRNPRTSLPSRATWCRSSKQVSTGQALFSPTASKPIDSPGGPSTFCRCNVVTLHCFPVARLGEGPRYETPLFGTLTHIRQALALADKARIYDNSSAERPYQTIAALNQGDLTHCRTGRWCCYPYTLERADTNR